MFREDVWVADSNKEESRTEKKREKKREDVYRKEEMLIEEKSMRRCIKRREVLTGLEGLHRVFISLSLSLT